MYLSNNISNMQRNNRIVNEREITVNNIIEDNIIITNNWEHYIPRIIYKKLFPVIKKKEIIHPQHILSIEKEKEQNEIINKKYEELKQISREKINNKIIDQNTPGTEAWFLNNFPGQLWPSHPLSDRLELVWGLVKITNSLQIIGIINNNIITNIKPYKQSCSKKSTGSTKKSPGGGSSLNKRLKSKNIKRKSCTGLGVDLKIIKKQKDAHVATISGENEKKKGKKKGTKTKIKIVK